MAVNEVLEKKVKELEDCTRCQLVDAGVDVDLTDLNDEIRRLRAENLALHSTLHCMHLLTACSSDTLTTVLQIHCCFVLLASEMISYY